MLKLFVLCLCLTLVSVRCQDDIEDMIGDQSGKRYDPEMNRLLADILFADPEDISRYLRSVDSRLQKIGRSHLDTRDYSTSDQDVTTIQMDGNPILNKEDMTTMPDIDYTNMIGAAATEDGMKVDKMVGVIKTEVTGVTEKSTDDEDSTTPLALTDKKSPIARYVQKWSNWGVMQRSMYGTEVDAVEYKE